MRSTTELRRPRLRKRPYSQTLGGGEAHFVVEPNFSRRLSVTMKSDPPKPTTDADRAKAEKAARLAQALRDNLRRRKAGKAVAAPTPDKSGD